MIMGATRPLWRSSPRCWNAPCRCCASAADFRSSTWRWAAHWKAKSSAGQIVSTTGRRRSDDLDQRYGPLHTIDITPGGRLAAILASRQIKVNSLHRQAIARLAEGLAVEARAPDGIVEAASVKGAAGFALGVQWHPEYKAAANPDSVKLFEAFGEAARRFAGERAEPHYSFSRA
jgi:gamma-glutamyl-gamma-aminobutyrate hydrolase PuuD